MPADDLNTAIREIAGTANNGAEAATLGPGITYLLALPSLRVHFFSRVEGAYPNAFYKLLESASDWAEIVVEKDQPAYREATRTETFEAEARYLISLNRRGETLPVVDYRRIVYDEAQNPVAIAGRLVDDSFRTVALESLARRSWKEIATSMTRRYLHDFNNTIAGIYSLSELYAEPGSDPKSTAEAMGHIRDCSIRAQDLTKKIRHLTTLEAGQESYFDLGSLVEEQKQYMEALLPKGAEIKIESASGELPARIDSNIFRQIILHLTGNASDAAGEDAAITIKLSHTEQDDRDFGVIDFYDNGPGFSEEGLEMATAPFYTTKDKDKHPGLGLSIVSKWTVKLGGGTTLSNTEQGARVRLILPLLDRENLDGGKGDAARPSATAASKPRGAAAKAASTPLKILVYTWEDITRHPLLLAMQSAGWEIRIHLDPGQLLIDLLQAGTQLDGVLVFKSALDEKADPLISELGHARNCDKVALVALGESVDALSVSTKRICGMVASGSTKPSALLNKLATFYR